MKFRKGKKVFLLQKIKNEFQVYASDYIYYFNGAINNNLNFPYTLGFKTMPWL